MTLFQNFFRRLRQWRIKFSRSTVVRMLLLIVTLIVVGTLVYARLEAWSLIDALYVTIITLTTVGYGDLSPQTASGRTFAIFFTLIAIGSGGYALTALAAYTIESRSKILAHKSRKQRMKRINELNDHFIICGADWLGTRLAHELYSANASFIIIDPSEKKIKTTLLFTHPAYFSQKVQSLVDIAEVDLSEYEEKSVAELADMLNLTYLIEDPTDDYVLLHAGIDRARGLITAMADDGDNLLITVGARELANRYDNSKLRIMVASSGGRHSRKFHFSGADEVRIPTLISGSEIALHMLYPELGNWWYSLTGVNKNSSAGMRQIALRQKATWIGRTVGEVHAAENQLILAIKREGRFLSPPHHDLTMHADDIAIVLGTAQA